MEKLTLQKSYNFFRKKIKINQKGRTPKFYPIVYFKKIIINLFDHFKMYYIKSNDSYKK